MDGWIFFEKKLFGTSLYLFNHTQKAHLHLNLAHHARDHIPLHLARARRKRLHFPAETAAGPAGRAGATDKSDPAKTIVDYMNVTRIQSQTTPYS